MNPSSLLLIGFGALAGYLVFKPKTASANVQAATNAGLLPVPGKKWNISSTPEPVKATKVPTINDSPSANMGNYLTHITNAANNLNVINNGAETDAEAHDVLQARADMSLPMDVLTVQKDLNVLGAHPPLLEDGIYGPKTKDAIDSFQGAMLLDRTGEMNSDTNFALRHAVVAVTSGAQS